MNTNVTYEYCSISGQSPTIHTEFRATKTTATK